jgi:hypothetical protein
VGHGLFEGLDRQGRILVLEVGLAAIHRADEFG